MSNVTLGGNAIDIGGDFPERGQQAKAFTLTTQELADVGLGDFAGKRKVLNIIPSVDTPTCAMSTRQFNERASNLDNTVVLVISADLPFAAGRFCGAEGLDNVTTLSSFRHPEFRKDYGVSIDSGPLTGLCARGVVVLDEQDRVLYSELVAEIKQEPDYEQALAALS